MPGAEPPTADLSPRLPAVSAYLLGTIDFDEAVSLQRRLTYDAAGEPAAPAIVLCDHPPGITVGRSGSRAHIRLPFELFTARGWDVRWLARGGGVTVHLPGQVACYPILPLDTLGLTPAGYVAALAGVAADVCSDFGVTAEVDADAPLVRVKGRRVGSVGVAVRHGVASFGLVLNVCPDLELFRGVDGDGDPTPPTSLQRECPAPVRVQAVRQRLLAGLAGRFGFGRLSVFHHHPSFHPRAPRYATPARHHEAG